MIMIVMAVMMMLVVVITDYDSNDLSFLVYHYSKWALK